MSVETVSMKSKMDALERLYIKCFKKITKELG